MEGLSEMISTKKKKEVHLSTSAESTREARATPVPKLFGNQVFPQHNAARFFPVDSFTM